MHGSSFHGTFLSMNEHIEIDEGQGASQDDTISLLDIFLVLFKRWKFIFFTTLITGVIILGYSFYTLKAPKDAPFNLLVNYYKPEVQIRVQDEKSQATSFLSQSNLGALAGLAGISGGGASSADLSMELLKGNTIIDEIVKEFDLINLYGIEKNPRSASRNMVIGSIETDYKSSTGILTISYTNPDPVLATKILNRLVHLLEERFKNLTMEKILIKKKFLEERISEVKAERKRSQEKLIQFQIDKGIVNINTVSDSLSGSSATELIFDKYVPLAKRHEISSAYSNMLKDSGILETVYNLLMQQYESSKIEEMDDTRTFQIIETAEIPEIKAGPSRSKISVIVTLTVFFLTVFLSFISEYFENVRKDPVESVKLDLIKKSIPFTRSKK